MLHILTPRRFFWAGASYCGEEKEEEKAEEEEETEAGGGPRGRRDRYAGRAPKVCAFRTSSAAILTGLVFLPAFVCV